MVDFRTEHRPLLGKYRLSLATALPSGGTFNNISSEDAIMWLNMTRKVNLSYQYHLARRYYTKNVFLLMHRFPLLWGVS